MAGILSDSSRAIRATMAYAQSTSPGDFNGIIARQFLWDEVHTKAAVGAFAAGDLNNANGTSVDFMQHLIRNSVVATLLPYMHRTQFFSPTNDPMTASASWVGGGHAIPVYSESLAVHHLARLKTATIAVFSKEALKQEFAEAVVSAALENACRNALDEQFLIGGGVDDERPAGITHGAVTITATNNAAHDFADLLQGQDLSRCFLVSDPTTCTRLGLSVSSGASLFSDCGARGGSVAGLPLITSASSPRDSGGGQFVLVDPTRIMVAIGAVEITRDEESGLQMMDAIDSNGTDGMISLFQTDNVALRCVLHANWKLLDPLGVRVLTGCDW